MRWVFVDDQVQKVGKQKKNKLFKFFFFDQLFVLIPFKCAGTGMLWEPIDVSSIYLHAMESPLLTSSSGGAAAVWQKSDE